MQIFLHFYERIFSKKPHFYERMFSGKLHFYERMFSGKLHFYERYGALAGLGIPIKEALRGFCNKIVTRLKHVSFPQKVGRQASSNASVTNSAVTL